MFFAFGCKNADKNNSTGNSEGSCYVQLFDGDNYSDDSIMIDGPGEYSNLSNLSGATKDWNSEADSFKLGHHTTVTFYSETGFNGESVTYSNGDQNPSVAVEPSSMKITCDK